MNFKKLIINKIEKNKRFHLYKKGSQQFMHLNIAHSFSFGFNQLYWSNKTAADSRSFFIFVKMQIYSLQSKKGFLTFWQWAKHFNRTIH